MMNPIELALPFVAALALCAVRWLPTILLVPVFGGHALSSVARAVVMLALALPAAPGVAEVFARAPLAPTAWLALAAKEAVLGTLLAGLVAVPFWAIEAAGCYLDYQRGGNPQALDPAMSVETSTLGTLMQQALIVFLMHSGGLDALLRIVATSYAVWPTLAELPPLGPDAWAPFGALLVAAMRFALTLAAPYLLALAAIEACFAVLSRVNAKFPAYVAALPFKSVALMLLIALTLPRLLTAASELAGLHALDARHSLEARAAAGSIGPGAPAGENLRRERP
ncbi:MAG: type III secretion system export apparatus subunit SctT [Trinickia sp.]